MSEKTRAELEAYFETDDTPSSAQFTDVFDSFINIQDDNYLVGGDPAITAYAGGGQANAYQLTKLVNGVTTVATGGDSVKCPAIAAGRFFAIVNAGANSLDLFPQSGEQIYGQAVDAAQAIAVGEKWLFATGGGIWVGIKSA